MEYAWELEDTVGRPEPTLGRLGRHCPSIVILCVDVCAVHL